MVVLVAGVGLAVLAEVGIVANSALVADAVNVRQILLVLAEGTVTVDTVVAVCAVQRLCQRLVDGNKAMTGVDELGVLETVRAVVPVWAVQALVADTVDELVTAIADGVVTDVPARVAQEIGQGRQDSLGRGGLEGVARVVTVLVANMASEAEVVVFARNAGNEFLLGEDLDAAVAGAGWLLLICDGLLLVGKGTWNLLLLGLLDLGLDLGCDALGGAVDDAAVLDETLDHPVAASGAVDAVVYAGRAEIVITTVAYTAVEVLVLHGLVAVVAVYDPRSAGVARLRAECET